MRAASAHIYLIIAVCSAFILSIWPSQHEFVKIATIGTIAFAAYLALFKNTVGIKFSILFMAAILVRIALIPFLPMLSDDYFRFIWDSRLWELGIHPFAHTPKELIRELPNDFVLLFENLNSADYKTIYPPISQLIFYLSSLCPSEGFVSEVIIMKSFMALAEIGTLYLISLLLAGHKMRSALFVVYAFNPLVITEIMGNLHQEGFMIFFLALFYYFFQDKRYKLAGIAMALSIASKLLPLLFCPLIFFYLKGKDRWHFTLTCLVSCIITFGLLVIGLEHPLSMFNSLDLYLRKFEFNASLYYLWRAYGYAIYGFNTIHLIGPINALFLALMVMWYSIRINKVSKSAIAGGMIMIYLAFLLLSATVHPWYVLLLVFLSVFIEIRAFMLWSFLILMTYINYSYPIYHENLLIVGIEYMALFGCIYLERDTFLTFIPGLDKNKNLSNA